MSTLDDVERWEQQFGSQHWVCVLHHTQGVIALPRAVFISFADVLIAEGTREEMRALARAYQNMQQAVGSDQ